MLRGIYRVLYDSNSSHVNNTEISDYSFTIYKQKSQRERKIHHQHLNTSLCHEEAPFLDIESSEFNRNDGQSPFNELVIYQATTRIKYALGVLFDILH